jgi:hypothetical protein
LVAVGSAFPLLKESAIAIYGPCLLAATLILIARGRYKWPAILIIAAASGAAAAAGLLLWCVGGLRQQRLLAEALANSPVSQWSIENTSGPGYRLLEAFWVMSPAVSLLAVAGIVVAIARLGSTVCGKREAQALAAFSIIFCAVTVAVPYKLDLRYLSVLFPLICMFAATAIVEVLSRFRPTLPVTRVVIASGLVMMAVADYQRFSRYFVQGDIQDLAVGLIFRGVR